MPSSIAARSGRSNKSRISSRRSALSEPSRWSVSASEKCTGIGFGRRPHFERHAMVAQQQRELLAVVVAEQVRPRQRGLVHAGTGDEAVAEPRVAARHRLRAHAHAGVALAHARVELSPRDERLQRLAQPADAVVVERGGVLQRGLCVGEGLGRCRCLAVHRSGVFLRGTGHGRDCRCIGACDGSRPCSAGSPNRRSSLHRSRPQRRCCMDGSMRRVVHAAPGSCRTPGCQARAAWRQ